MNAISESAVLRSATELDASPRAGPVRVQIVHDAAGLDALRADWDALWAADPGADVFGSWAWFRNWWQHFGHGESPAALAVNDGEEWLPVPGGHWRLHVCVVRDPTAAAVALLPLVRIRGRYKRWQGQFLATPVNSHSPRAGLVATRFDAAVADALCGCLDRDPGWDLLLLDGLADTPGGRAERLVEGLSRRGLAIVEQASWRQSYMDCDGSWEAMLGRRNHKFRLHLGQNERSLAKLGALQVDRHAGEDAIGAGFDAFLAIDRTSWKAREGESIDRVAALRSYYHDILRRLAPHGGAEVWVLSVAGTPAAAFLCLADGRSLYTLKTSFSESFGRSSRLSPSQVLLARIIEQGWGLHPRGIDFVGKAPLVDRWATRENAFSHRLLRRRPVSAAIARVRRLWPGGERT